MTEASLMAFAFGFEIPIMKGCIAFNAGMSYKNSLASSLAKYGFVGGKYIKMFLNAKRVLLLGIERGLTYVSDKIGAIGDQLDWLIDQVVFIMNLTDAFARAGDFADYANKFFNEDLQVRLALSCLAMPLRAAALKVKRRSVWN